MTAADYKSARKALGHTQGTLASVLGLSRSAITRRETGKLPITAEAALAIRAVGKRIKDTTMKNTVTVNPLLRESLTRAGLTFAPAPNPSTGTVRNTLNGVWHAPNERIEWLWTHSTEGSYVSGYNLR